jgi:hypothetical protein
VPTDWLATLVTVLDAPWDLGAAATAGEGKTPATFETEPGLRRFSWRQREHFIRAS